MSVPASFSPGTVFAGDYRIDHAIGQGGMGAIFAAEQLSTGKMRALKLMHPTLVTDDEHRRRFVQEARVGSRIQSEHVVEVQAAGIDQATGAPYIVMELLVGETLQQRCRRAGAMTLPELRVVFEQLCHAIAAAHAAGIVHRDLKPENVFLANPQRAAGPSVAVKVLDFGIAKLVAEAGTRGTTGAMGSPLWMAPEQTEAGTITPAADVWALGLIAYYALTGTFFWRSARDSRATVSQLFREIVLEEIPPASRRAGEQSASAALPPGFDAWFARCVAREPGARWQTAAECWTAMRGLFGDMAPISNEEVFGPTMGIPASTGPMTKLSETPAPPTPAPMAPAPPTPRVASPPEAIPQGTPAPMAHTNPPVKAASMGPWILGSSAVIALAIVGSVFALVRAGNHTTSVAEVAVTPSSTTMTVARGVPAPPMDSSTTVAAPLASSAAPAASSAPGVAAAATPPAIKSAPKPSAPVAGGKVWSWKVSGHTVHIQSTTIVATGNVPEDVIRKAIDWDGWEYGRCYERAFGKADSLPPKGTVTIKFKIFDQLPQKATVDRSDFTNAAFNECVRGTLVGQTANAAGSSGFADVTYTFLFTLAD